MNTFEVGSDVIHDGIRMRVLDPVYSGMITLAPLHDLTALCKVPIAEVSLAPPVMTPFKQVDPVEWRGLEGLANAARDIIAAPTTQERKARYERHSLDLGCSQRRLQRAICKLRNVDAVSALQAARSGRRAGLRLLEREVEDVITQQLNDCWLVRQQPALSPIIAQIQSECRKKGLREPCSATIRERAAALDVYRVMALRKGAKKAKYALKALVGHIQAALALETVQIDHTLADTILVSEDDRSIPVGRPWVTFAVDVATRVVAGVYVSFEPPSAVSVAMCLANALLPKEPFLESLALKGSWPVSGALRCIHMDNGRDFHSDALQRGCSQLGIDIQYRPVGSPHYGGIIERLIGTFMGRCRLLPGATQNNVVRRDDYDAEGKAALTLREFRTFLVNEIVNVYHTTEHRELGVPPLIKWEQLQSSTQHSNALPAGWDNWMLQTTFFPYEMRLVRRTGIQMFNRFYWADGLEEWIGDGVPRAVSYDPGDLSKVFIVGPSGLVLVAHDTRADARPLSLYEHREERRRCRALCRDPSLLDQLDQGLAARQRIVKAATKATKKAHRRTAIAGEQQQRSAGRPARDPASGTPSATNAPSIDFNTPARRPLIHRKGG